MTSMRKLRRRLLRWERYAAKVGHRFGDGYHERGLVRARVAAGNEYWRRYDARAPYAVTEHAFAEAGLL